MRFSDRSKTKLMTCDARLRAVMQTAIEYSYIDFSILEGHRSPERQRQLFDEGKSQLDGIARKSKHQSLPSLAVDIAPWPIDWHDTKRFYFLAGFIMSIAKDVNVALRWGGDWNGNGDFDDQQFFDLPHFEIKE